MASDPSEWIFEKRRKKKGMDGAGRIKEGIYATSRPQEYVRKSSHHFTSQ